MATGRLASVVDAIAARASPGLSRLALALLALLAIHDLTGTIRVVDGDTVDRWMWRWRLAGIDAPEIRRAVCPAEKAAGFAARDRLAALIAGGTVVRLVPVQWRLDKYGRVVGRLLVDGVDVAPVMIAEGHARAYDGRSRREGWCGE
jgi:endonuclease YncB( thermonuclease family)